MMKDNETVLRQEIFKLVRELFQLRSSKAAFNPEKDLVRYSGAVYDHDEVESMINAILDGWFGVGKYTHRFEAELAKFLGVGKAVMTNSGSSANLLAASALLSSQLGVDAKLEPGDEVITPALTFPTTFNPIIQNHLIPVLLDVDIGTYNISAQEVRKALSRKTRAIFVPHTLGNPNEMDVLVDFAEEHDLFLIEDACDALGSKYDGRYVGSFGAFGTFSFYPAHQITTGEGGAIVTSDEKLSKIALSLRDWGRACNMSVCNPLHCPEKGCSKSSHHLKTSSLDDLPEDYDKRYTYINIGYNLKPTEIQAAMGLVQLSKLPGFIELRKRNFNLLYDEFQDYEDFFILPELLPKSDPCWFAFPLTIKKNAPFKRKDVVQWLTKFNVEVKMLFSGNLIKHPAYKSTKYRLAQKLTNSDRIMRNSFFVGVYPGMTEEKIKYMLNVFKEFMSKHR
jgi:CDP-6-deoxy-D-xylo-4-hexulose-3-dehydrase